MSVEPKVGLQGYNFQKPVDPLVGDPVRQDNDKIFGNGPSTLSESTVSNTELSEFFAAH